MVQIVNMQMPYIDSKTKERIEPHDSSSIRTAGELNYTITTLIKGYLEFKGESYQTYNDIMGALEGAKLELYARKVRPYEDKKIKENGDVW